MRYIVSIKVYDSNVDLTHLDSARFHQLKTGLEQAVSGIFKRFLPITTKACLAYRIACPLSAERLAAHCARLSVSYSVLPIRYLLSLFFRFLQINATF